MQQVSYTIDSYIKIRGQFKTDWSTEIIKNEPMFFNCDFDFACKHGGPITIDFLTNLPDDWLFSDIVIDSRVHMLMKGWYPCIPGYHHDDVPRSSKDGQPNYDTPEYRSEHLMGLVNGHICPTEFALGSAKFNGIMDNHIIYKYWHQDVISKISKQQLSTQIAPSGVYIEFNDRTWHQGVKASVDGWRWFIRVSKNTDRVKNITNEIRRQVQVYMENPMEGW